MNGIGLGFIGLGQMGGPDRTHFLVVRQYQNKGVRECMCVASANQIHGLGDEAFHVAGAAPEVCGVGLGQCEGVASPLGFVRRHNVHVSAERQAVPLGRLISRRTDSDDQVDLVRVRVREAVDLDAGPIQIFADKVGNRHVAVATDRVEPDQSAQQFRIGKFGAHSRVR
ncbi:MAG: hypothetical protein IIA68_11060 [Proteobacteria bacterium]|nr:hypothetical protein [Pseudomonadota bacterium]